MNEAELLTVVLHELGSPLFAAVLELRSLRDSMRRLVRVHHIFGVIRAELAGEREVLPPFDRRTVLKAIVSLKTGEVSIVPQLSRRMAVLAASGALDTVLQTLVDNVRRHAHGSAVTIRAYELAEGPPPWPAGSPVTLSGPAVVVEVADTGPGVPTQLRPTLFSFGATSKPGLGTGAGLWLSRLLVRAHGGDLWLADSPRGAVFVSVWPMAPPKQRPIASEPRPVSVNAWPTDPQEFGQAVRRAREAAHITRDAFVAEAGLSHYTLRNLETRRHRCTQATRLKVIAQFVRLGISPPPNS